MPHHLDEGIRLEIRTPEDFWQPIRFYTPTLNTSNVSTVSFLDENITVEAKALTYSSVFPLEKVKSNQILTIREYICDEQFWNTTVTVDIRWMQRYSKKSVANISTWSLDDMRIVLWNGECRQEVFTNTFDNNTSM